MSIAFRFTYQIIVSFNPEVIGPHDIKHYTFWNELNRFYGAVEVNTQLAHEHKAIIEFEPGMYNNIQMKAIRDEYVKLPSIRFGWVMGKTAIQVNNHESIIKTEEKKMELAKNLVINEKSPILVQSLPNLVKMSS